MTLETYLRAMPKVELHVHLEGAIRPETLIKLAQKHAVPLPDGGLAGLREMYRFTDFDNFLNVYRVIGKCLRTAEDIELITREFLAGQAEQNILHSEVTYTTYSQFKAHGISFEDQLDAINRARAWAEKELGVGMTLTLDISREISPEEGMITAEWAVSALGDGVTALGLGGPEVGNPPEKFAQAFEMARSAGLPGIPHAGETAGAESVWGALNALNAVRIGHGVRCLEDDCLVDVLRERQIPLEVCPTSNVCLKVVSHIEDHPLPRLLDAGLNVTINSDDPPMFNTTLNDEYVKIAKTFNLQASDMEKFSLNALRSSLLPDAKKRQLEMKFLDDFTKLRVEHLQA